MTEEEYLQFKFIFIELKKHGLQLRKLFQEDIDDLDLVDSGKLLESIGFELHRAGVAGGVLSFWFPSYGRFIEINYFKRNNNRKNAIDNLRANRHALRRRSGLGRGKKKDTRWYAHNVYGSQNDLIRALSWGYTENVRLDLKAQFTGLNKK